MKKIKLIIIVSVCALLLGALFFFTNLKTAYAETDIRSLNNVSKGGLSIEAYMSGGLYGEYTDVFTESVIAEVRFTSAYNGARTSMANQQKSTGGTGTIEAYVCSVNGKASREVRLQGEISGTVQSKAHLSIFFGKIGYTGQVYEYSNGGGTVKLYTVRDIDLN